VWELMNEAALPAGGPMSAMNRVVSSASRIEDALPGHLEESADAAREAR
jgi:hypothetical protein